MFVPLASGLVQLNPDFDAAWTSSDARDREMGLGVGVLAKPRPVLILAVGAVEEDTTHRNDIWVVPLYSEKERPRRGRNLFPLPAWEPAGLSLPSVLDFFQVATVPLAALRGRPHPCDVRPAVFDAVLAKFRACLK